jgi:hypothetical protein
MYVTIIDTMTTTISMSSTENPALVFDFARSVFGIDSGFIG